MPAGRCPLTSTLIFVSLAASAAAADPGCDRMPRLTAGPWRVAGNPDLGPLTRSEQEPVDFAIWQARDGSWQIWSCIRKTGESGNTRLFYRWEGKSLTSPDWTPMGIAMRADPAFGETPGGLQAPYVFRYGELFWNFYGTWESIALAQGADGKTFARQLGPDHKSGLFSEGVGTNTRDVMILRVGQLWHAYYTAFPNRKGAVYARTSPDLKHWSDSKIVAFGGAAGDGPFSAECPFVFYLPANKRYYLFRTQRYGVRAQTSVYCSADPLDFGVNSDSRLMGTMEVAAPEIVPFEGKLYMAYLLPSLKGIQIAPLAFEPVSR